MPNTHVNPSTLFALPQFSQAVIEPSGRIAHIAGQGAFDRDFNLIGKGDLHAQTVQAFNNLKHALEAVGSDPAHVLSSTIYIVDLDAAKTDVFVKAMLTALDGKPFPPNASTILGVTALGSPDMLVEISAVAAIP
jgi:enamine deaminase RidA (YjgF/YER057c/UK114 family)